MREPTRPSVSLLDRLPDGTPARGYAPSTHTDVAKLFHAVRAEMARQSNVKPMKQRRPK